MSEEETTILAIKGAISELPPAQQANVRILADMFRATLKTYEGTAHLAFALVGAEIQRDTPE